VEGRKLRFKLECRDEKEIIGRDFDERAVIDPARFLAPPEKKAAG
jgi:fluoroacetyl-CoA thioesterase